MEDREELGDRRVERIEAAGIGAEGWQDHAPAVGQEAAPAEAAALHRERRSDFLRQQWLSEMRDRYYSMADFVAPQDSGRQDFLGAFAVSASTGTRGAAGPPTASSLRIACVAA